MAKGEKYWKEVGAQADDVGNIVYTYEHNLPDAMLLLVVVVGAGGTGITQTVTRLPYEIVQGPITVNMR